VQKRNKTKDLREAAMVVERKQRGMVQNLRHVIHQRRSAAVSSSSSSSSLWAPTSVAMMMDVENMVPNAQDNAGGGLTIASNSSNNGRNKQQVNRSGHQDLSGGTQAASIQFWKDMAAEWGGGHVGEGRFTTTTTTVALTTRPPVESWPRLLGTQAERLQSQATRMVHAESAPLHRIVIGYQKHLQLNTSMVAAVVAARRQHVAADDPAQDGDKSTDDHNDNNDSIDAFAAPPNQE
jgi:hypothetical protein